MLTEIRIHHSLLFLRDLLLLRLVFFVILGEVFFDEFSFGVFLALDDSRFFGVFSRRLLELVLLRFFLGNASRHLVLRFFVFGFEDFFEGGFPITSLLKKYIENWA